MSSDNTERQLRFMCDLESTIICCTSSYVQYLAESIEEQGIEVRIKLKEVRVIDKRNLYNN